MVSSYVVCKIMVDQHGLLNLKVKLIFPKCRNKDRFTVRRGFTFVNMTVIGLLHSLASILSLIIESANVRRAYMESGPINVKFLFVRQNKFQSVAWHESIFVHYMT